VQITTLGGIARVVLTDQTGMGANSQILPMKMELMPHKPVVSVVKLTKSKKKDGHKLRNSTRLEFSTMRLYSMITGA